MARAAGPQWLLRRFRRASAPPGRPAHALGVPAGAGDLADELQPLLMALDEVERDGASIRERAAADADAHASHAIEDAERLLREASARAEAERARAAQDHRSRANERTAEILRDAEAEAARVTAQRDARVDELVTEVLACVRQAGC